MIDLPAGPINHHWTKNIIASPDGSKLYVTVGSNSNVGENGMDDEEGRAAIWEVDRDSGAHRIFARACAIPTAWPGSRTSGALWTVVNERDELGSDLVPDYLTSVQRRRLLRLALQLLRPARRRARASRRGPTWWPRRWCPTTRWARTPRRSGLAFADGAQLPAPFANGMFIGQHGSWNRKPHSGYKVIFVPFDDGKPAGEPVDVLTGFLSDDGDACGRPVGVAHRQAAARCWWPTTSATSIWRVSAKP